MKEEKESILFKKLDLTFVYIIIFIFGMLLVFFMTSYLNSKVAEFTTDAYTQSN